MFKGVMFRLSSLHYAVLLLFIAGTATYFLAPGWSRDDAPSRIFSSPGPPPAASLTSPSEWSFDYQRDGRRYGLDASQCHQAFPRLYTEIDRAVAYRQRVGKVQQTEVDVAWRGDGAVRAMIRANQLYVIDPHGVWDHNHRPRAMATLHAMQRAVSASPHPLPDIEFGFVVHDAALIDADSNRTTWAYARLAHQESLWLMPDFGLWAWPDVGLRSYGEFLDTLDHEEEVFYDKVTKLVWRGSLAVGSGDVRHGLVKHSQDRVWSDVQTLDWSNKSNIAERLLTMADHCAYKFLAHTEGNSYSGRLKYLLNCHSLLFSHDLRWIEHYHHLMHDAGPEQNYVKARRDYADLPKLMERWADPANWPSGQKIADNARETFRERYLTPAAEACYWRAMFQGWASVQDFEPEYWHKVEEFDKVTRRVTEKSRPRGVPFEAYAIMEELEWEIPTKARKICIDE